MNLLLCYIFPEIYFKTLKLRHNFSYANIKSNTHYMHNGKRCPLLLNSF